jgi:conjugal transfer/entry exclusion protein
VVEDDGGRQAQAAGATEAVAQLDRSERVEAEVLEGDLGVDRRHRGVAEHDHGRLTADQFETEESTMASLRSMSQSADGQMKALQVGHQIAAQQVAQMQKLRGLVSQQMTMMGTWLQTSQTDKDLAQARRERFFNAPVRDIPSGQKMEPRW